MSAPEVEIQPLNAGTSSGASSPSAPPRARMMKDESHIVGREDSVNELVSQLKDKSDSCANLRVISVVGEEAIGKTALVRSVCNRADIKNHFDCCAWVRVGPKPDLFHLMAVLLKQMRVPELRDAERMDEKKLFNELQGVLMECRYLIVLDDLCDLDVMDELIMVLVDSRNGSRVIVTTRNRDIPSFIDPWYSKRVELSPLDREQSEKLFEESSGACDNPSAELRSNLKKRILSLSGGSPGKILLLGGLLSATTSDRCTELANLLTNGLPDRPALQDVVRLSVDDLPKGLKQCALYLALFPKESEIPTRRLFRLWSADLVSSPSENRETRVDAEKYFEDLVTRNMVHVARRKLDGSARTCRLPRTLHDVFSQRAKDERFLKNYACPTPQTLRTLHEAAKFDVPRIAIHRHISGEGKVQENAPEVGRECSETTAQEAHKEITSAEANQRMSNSDIPEPCGIEQLLCYVSFNTMKLGTRAREIEELLKPLVPKRNSIPLRVLDLERVYKPLLPEELGNILPNLKYLGLRWTVLESLPKSVARLRFLETLDLKYTNVTQVPVSIWEAKNLQHLYMNEVSFDESVHRQLDSKESLNCNIQTIWGLYIGVQRPMTHVLRKLTGLRKLALTCHPSVVRDVTEQISHLTMLKSLRLRSKGLLRQPSDLDLSDMRGLESLSNLYLLGYLGRQSLMESRSLMESHIPPNLKVLTLSMSGLDVDPMEVLGKLKCLTTLRLFASSYVGKTSSVSEGTFPSLRVLKLWKLENLTEWTIKAKAMQCLEDLEIKGCKKLKTIDGLGQIETLEKITLVEVPDELELSVRVMQRTVPIIADELVIDLPQDENLEEQSDEDFSRRGEEEEEQSDEDFSRRGEEEDDYREDSEDYDDRKEEDSEDNDDGEEEGEEAVNIPVVGVSGSGGIIIIL